MKISIFTPTYNRAQLLVDVYTSLCNQKSNDFEWIIVDDGSTDDTESFVSNFVKEAIFSITYYKQTNSGKHFAINKGLDLAKGDYFLILDSDDRLPLNAITTISNYIDKSQNIPDIGGVAGRRNYSDGSIVGNQNFDEIITNSIDIRYKYKVTGDLVEIYKTKVLKRFLFPEIQNEKFCPEDLVWNRIATEFNLLFFNKGIYTTQYLADGLTAKIVKIRMTSPIASMLTYAELTTYSIPLLQKIKANINFWRFAFNSNKSFGYKWQLSKGAFWGLLMPLGYIMFCRDKIHNPNK